MDILQVNTADRGGGAEGSARNLLHAYRERGHGAWLAVGRKFSDDPDVLQIPLEPAPTAWGRALQCFQRLAVRGESRLPGARRLARCCGILADKRRLADWWHGREDFNFPGSDRLLDLPPRRPDLVHCHNLHGWYFDLRFLPVLSRQVPVILNLRDTWLLTGHCGHFFQCHRWQTGCGSCPDLAVYPRIRRDATAENWQCKSEIYRQGRFFVTAPSRWLLDCVERSMLKGVDTRVIPNGIDLTVFRPGSRQAARESLGLPPDARIALFAAASARTSRFKDFDTLETAAASMAGAGGIENLLLVCLGQAGGSRTLRGGGRVRFVPFVHDAERVAQYYRAADVYLHAARAESFGKSITEAMACGIPVVATAVGGIPEQILDGRTGYLVPAADPDAMARQVTRILTEPGLARELGEQAADHALQFSLQQQASRFLQWYEQVLEQFA